MPSDILALDWLSYTTVSLGCRDGSIRLYDTRSGGSSHVLTHPYPISRLKRADAESRLVCSGLQDSLFLYDIRSPRLSPSSSLRNATSHYTPDYFKTLYPGGRATGKRRKLNRHAVRSWSQPLLSFAHANRDELELDVAVHAQLGLVAAAQDVSTGAAIRVSNMWTGKTVREMLVPGEQHQHQQRGPQKGGWEKERSIRALKFVEGRHGAGVELWSCWEGGIAKFSL